jgi:transcriptional regulator with XRE-family HTH domain
MAHPAAREKAVSLRRAGFPYSHISRVTGISKSTLSDWLSAIPYTPNAETIERVGKAIAAANARKTALKQESIRKIQHEARAQVGKVSKRDLFMFGLGLYLGEGSKTGDVTRVVNADVQVIRLTIAWFESLGVRPAQFLLTLHLYPDTDVRKCLRFWSEATTIPVSQFGKVQTDTRRNKRMYKNGKLPYGTAHLSVRGLGRKEYASALARRIKGWTNAVEKEVLK